jgi:ribonuclease D
VPDAADPAATTADVSNVPLEAHDDASTTDAPTATPLIEPRDGVPEVIVDADELPGVAEALAAGHGPFAVDAERASGYRYGQRAYLVQIRREGAGTFLIDPIGTGPLDVLQPVLAEAEWILHAATQDLPCLAEIGLRPTTLFDTELAGRLAGRPRVGLGPLVEQALGLALEKGHGAADWSTRPLPEAWLRYAALDVEVLVELRDALAEDLAAQGKLEWAHEEFAAIVAAPPPPARIDPWRRTSGLQRVRKPAQLAVVRELWTTRDRLAQKRDLSPGRLLPDASIVAAAAAMPRTKDALQELGPFKGRGARRYLNEWWSAIERALAVDVADLPRSSLPPTGPPAPRAWVDRDPDAAARLSAARHRLGIRAEQLGLPVENLLTPDLVRRLCWEPPAPIDAHQVAARLRDGRARAWQIAQTTDLLVECLTATAATADSAAASDDAPEAAAAAEPS